MIFFKGHKFNYAPDLNEFQTQNKSKTLIHPDQLYPIQSMISERTVPSMFFSQFDLPSLILPRLIHERDTLWAIDCDEVQVHNNYLI